MADIHTADVDDLTRWRAWAAQLTSTFETADRVWLSIDQTLDATRFALRASEAGTQPVRRARRGRGGGPNR